MKKPLLPENLPVVVQDLISPMKTEGNQPSARPPSHRGSLDCETEQHGNVKLTDSSISSSKVLCTVIPWFLGCGLGSKNHMSHASCLMCRCLSPIPTKLRAAHSRSSYQITSTGSSSCADCNDSMGSEPSSRSPTDTVVEPAIVDMVVSISLDTC